MLYKIKRLSHYGTRFPKPCDSAIAELRVDKDGLSPVWLVELNVQFDIFALIKEIGKHIIIEVDGTIVIYDDWYE